MLNDEETSGTAKGSLKDRLRVLYILLKIARKQKMKCQIASINTSKLSRTNKITPFFYTPVKMVISKNSRIENIILYDGIINENIFKLNRLAREDTLIELYITKVRNFRKGLGSLEEIIASNRETNTFPIIDDLPSREAVIEYLESKALPDSEYEKWAQEYETDVKNLTSGLIYDILILKYYSDVLFEEKLDEETIQNFIKKRVEANYYMESLNDLADSESEIKNELQNKDSEQYEQLKNEIAFSKYQVEKLEQLLFQQKQELDLITTKINDFKTVNSIDRHLKGLGSSFGDFIGIGLGLLTLPFSASRTFALGTNLIRNSVTNIKKNVKLETKEKISREYNITEQDIKTAADGIKTSTFFLDDIFKNLNDIKFGIKYYKDHIPDSSKMLKQIELMERALVNKRINLRKLEESLEKSKIKVLERKKVA
ncbi:MAG: hypothetical protein IJB71_00970 [Bacilli bacterium]|nr:hypothetical protein [Bacilli bacterium]